ncbi:hypothetical protein VNI00_003752 [Paramarasmius palmivorus]|uniref:C2H2-type domain-containing protein n=1 Tax=Paramarasmius palmivorus TaxID=297713 RepID=A0AAW0DSF7_9AGAR
MTRQRTPLASPKPIGRTRSVSLDPTPSTEPQPESTSASASVTDVGELWMAYRRSLRKNDAVKEQRAKDIQKRLLKMGFKRRDWYIVKDMACVKRSNPLTDRGWATIQNQLVDAINQANMYNKEPLLESRVAMIRTAYSKYKERLPGMTWRTLPSHHVVQTLPSILHLKVSPDMPEYKVTQADFDTLFRDITKFQREVQAWLHNQKKGLLDDPSWSRDPNGWRYLFRRLALVMENRLLPDFTPGDPTFNMDLAVIEIKCYDCRTEFCGFSAWVRHFGPNYCKPKSKGGGKFRSEIRFSDMAALCVSRDGLDVISATVDDMDQKGSTFECGKCPFRGSWRDLIKHTHSVACPYSKYYIDRIFDVRDTRAMVLSVKERYDGKLEVIKIPGNCVTLSSDRKEWACNRCYEHVEERVSRQVVLDHLLVKHGVSGDANVPTDYFYANT